MVFFLKIKTDDSVVDMRKPNLESQEVTELIASCRILCVRFSLLDFKWKLRSSAKMMEVIG